MTVVYGHSKGPSEIDIIPENIVVETETLTEDFSTRRANATFVFLCRNNDVEGAVDSIQQMESRFNKKYKYPWVLLNEEPFTPQFKKLVHSMVF